MLYTAAASAGFIPSANALAIMYELGWATVDGGSACTATEMATKMYSVGAVQGDPAAMFGLGSLLVNNPAGSGCSNDRGTDLLRAAAGKGHKGARNLLKRLAP